MKKGEVSTLRGYLRLFRKRNPLSPEEMTTVNAAIELRMAKGAFSEPYTQEERELIDRGRQIAVEHAQPKVWHFLRLQKWPKYGVIDVRRKRHQHACPLCGKIHDDPSGSTMSPSRQKSVFAKALAQIRKEHPFSLKRRVAR